MKLENSNRAKTIRLKPSNRNIPEKESASLPPAPEASAAPSAAASTASVIVTKRERSRRGKKASHKITSVPPATTISTGRK